MTGAGILRHAAVVALIAGSGVVGATQAGAEPCPGSSGVTVVVDDGSGSDVRCASGRPDSAWDALLATGHSVTPVQRFPEAICQIDSHPDSPCLDMPPASAYWAFFTGSPGGQWVFSQVGARSGDLAPGSVVGFAFGGGHAPSSTPPTGPSSSPPQSSPPPSSTTAPPGEHGDVNAATPTNPTLAPTDPALAWAAHSSASGPSDSSLTRLGVGGGIIAALGVGGVVIARRRRSPGQ